MGWSRAPLAVSHSSLDLFASGLPLLRLNRSNCLYQFQVVKLMSDNKLDRIKQPSQH